MSQGFLDDNDNIKIVRGDCASFEIESYNADGSPYILEDHDHYVFTVKESPYSEEILLRIELPKKEAHVDIKNIHTNNLDFGTYRYDIELIFGDGERNTTIQNKRFRVAEEVGWQ